MRSNAHVAPPSRQDADHNVVPDPRGRNQRGLKLIVQKSMIENLRLVLFPFPFPVAAAAASFSYNTQQTEP